MTGTELIGAAQQGRIRTAMIGMAQHSKAGNDLQGLDKHSMERQRENHGI
jgi:hypothetical protein